MLRARGSIQVDGDTSAHNHRRVIAKVQVARNAKDNRNRSQKNNQCQPTAIESVCPPGKPEWPHGVALHHRRMARDAANRESEDECTTRLPCKVETPAYPQCTRAQIGRR